MMKDYLIDIKWFNKIHCRHPLYQCLNFIEFYILNDKNEPIDSICLYPQDTVDNRFYRVDKKTFEKIEKYMNTEVLLND